MTVRPLEGLQVVECASFVAGPTAGLALSRLGADVVRIDPLGGANDHKRWPVAPSGDSYYWAALNRGKRSVAVDMRSDEGRELVVALITAPGPDRGVLVDNIVGRRWMSNEVLTQRRADLIHVRVQGHPDGRPAVDYTVNAEVGLPEITGSAEGGAPVNHVLPAWDLITGMTVATGVLAALRDRDRHERGAYIGNHVYGSFGVDFLCKDGERVMVVALTEGQWKALCTVTGTGDVFSALEAALGADLTEETDRYRLRETIAAILRPWFAARSLEQASRELDEARVLWSAYRGMTDVVAAHRKGTYPVLSDEVVPGAGAVVAARTPLRWNGTHGPAGPSPLLGRETDEVLAERLGLSSAEIGGLHERGVV